MLKIDNLHAAYGGIKALRGVSIEVKPGECVAVLGANGAGKSTLLKIISAIMKPVSGSITFYDRKIPSFPYQVVQSGIVHVPEGRQIFPNLTVYENLMVGAFLRNDKNGINRDLEWVYTLFPRLKERQHQYGGLLSGGEQQMLAISRGLMAHPKLLLLDEPSLGLAPIIVNQIFEILKEINKSGTAILIVEQNAYKALSVADRGYIMSTGVIEKSGTSKELLSDEKLLKAYLGD
ncbi:MAG: branched-chain amino acid transport system ATP-binding protein [Tepidanaerobacteraceae bacterium]|nr:branched-chain amino acid transport system ATP-binding protein [Tepidanaerobacteraceae bacterium]